MNHYLEIILHCCKPAWFLFFVYIVCLGSMEFQNTHLGGRRPCMSIKNGVQISLPTTKYRITIVRKDVGKDLLVFLGLLWHYLNTVSVWFSLSLFRDPSARKGIHRKCNSKRFAILMKFTHFHAGIISIISSNVYISAHHNCYNLFTVHELTTKKIINTFLA